MSNEGLTDLIPYLFWWKIGDFIYISTILEFNAISLIVALAAWDTVGIGFTVRMTTSEN